ncbi:MAG: hypothetical protein GQ535_02910 [Rhodobacteraceae bacterium]|nr:hypothetical protein [Paracoccaceae bacterium]
MKFIKNVLGDLISLIVAFLMIGVIIAPILEKIAPPNPAAQESSDRFLCAIGLAPRDSICVQDLYADLLIRFDALTAEHDRLSQQMAVQSPEIGP